MKLLQSYLPTWKPSASTTTDDETMRIDDYQAGYPRFTALVAAHSYFLCRRFDRLRARLLLSKQDKLSMLEKRLDEVDQKETSLLFLGKSRCDRNPDRIALLSEIESSLGDYDQFVERTSRMLSYGHAQRRDRESLHNWLGGTGSLARDETAYLTHRHELVSLAPTGDAAVSQLETWVEDKLIHFGFLQSRLHASSADSNVFCHSGSLIKQLAKSLLLVLITLLLMMPIIICNILTTTTARIVIVMASTITYLLILSGLTRSKTMELILAGATYATVLIVFVSGTSGILS
ncbi:hypothetical protein F4677DRAFT_76026 [Hypoxylon crocopeplum]|nr:hypothetical protein F4677DRAFT_76026 [Hypoxylon crocopeplum]